MKRSICILLIIVTAISCFPVASFAQYTVVSDEGRLLFEDVKSEHWFYEAVLTCYANGIIKGMNEYTFGYSGQLTRAQFVTMLCNLEGVDTSTYTVNEFVDVKANHWYYGAVAWAYANGIVSGMTDTTFAPNQPLTRAQLATVMYNYMSDKYTVEISDDILDKFSDKPKTEYWYYDTMKYAVSAGLLSGMNNGTLSAADVVTRAQAAVIFKNFIDKFYYASCEHSFSEATCTESSACSDCGFVNGLPKGHSMPTTYNCKTSKLCYVCNTKVEPSKIHDFAPANCGNPRICRVCGVKRGEATGDHKELWAATCTKPAMCKTCYHTIGEALGHTTNNGVCGRCGTANFSNMYDRTVYHIKSVGTYDPDTNSISYLLTRGTLVINHGIYSVSFDYYSFVIYHIATDSIEISNIRTNSWHDDVEMSAILVNRYDAKCQLAYTYYNSKGKLVRYATGFIDKTKYTTGALPSFSSCDIGNADMYTVRYSCGQNLDLALERLHFELQDNYGGGLKDIGFTNYLHYIPRED